MKETNSRHFAIVGLSAMGVAAILTNHDTALVTAIVAAIGGIFVWDKIEKEVKGGVEVVG